MELPRPPILPSESSAARDRYGFINYSRLIGERAILRVRGESRGWVVGGYSRSVSRRRGSHTANLFSSRFYFVFSSFRRVIVSSARNPREENGGGG